MSVIRKTRRQLAAKYLNKERNKSNFWRKHEKEVMDRIKQKELNVRALVSEYQDNTNEAWKDLITIIHSAEKAGALRYLAKRDRARARYIARLISGKKSKKK